MTDEALIRGINALNHIYNPDPPREGVLYHYTDFEGLRGILQSHKLRATYNRVLNDASEQIHAESVLSEELKRSAPSVLSAGPVFDQKPHFVTCFCESAKLLSMWRSYAARGGGYCLGFDYDRLKDFMCWPEPSVGQSVPLLVPVLYGCASESIRSYLDASCQSGSAIAPYLSSMIKHDAFAEEREWRIIARDPPRRYMMFRSGTANIRPSIDLSWKAESTSNLPLVSVTFGPTLRKEDRPKEIIEWMLEKFGYRDITVRESGIPFRL